jgi:hypothetical protein
LFKSGYFLGVSPDEGPVLLGCIDACVGRIHNRHLDAAAVREPAELFKRFRVFEMGGGHGEVGPNGPDRVGINPNMAHGRFSGGVARKRQRSTGEIEGTAVHGAGHGLGKHGLDDIGIIELVLVVDWRDHGADAESVELRLGGLGGIDDVRFNLGLVALHIDHDLIGIEPEAFAGLGEAACAVGVLGGGHDGLEAVGFDGSHNFLGIGSDHHAGDARSLAGLLADVHDKRLAGLVGEGFGGESGGAEACGDDGNRVGRRRGHLSL